MRSLLTFTFFWICTLLVISQNITPANEQYLDENDSIAFQPERTRILIDTLRKRDEEVYKIISESEKYNPNKLPDTYKSVDNPYYWKNNPPSTSYWQQDVAYTMEVKLVDSLNVIDASKYQLIYTNNSPDTLYDLYFHLYQNAFQPGSYLSSNYENNGYKIKYGEYEGQRLGTSISELQVDGKSVDTTLDNTILKIRLNSPLPPNQKTVVDMKFKSYFDSGSLRRRMKTFTHDGVKHFDAVHWYPSICVYDPKFGWTTEQHLDKEFYADFGSFNVKIDIPEHYIIGATGTLQNKETVFTDSLRDLLDLSNYEDRSNSLVYNFDSSSYKTWWFYAENVHNFAFTADPSYRIGEVKWNEIIVQTLAQEKNAWGWKKSGPFAAKVIQTYSRDFGMYAWPKIIIADARDGMEYPMLTLDGGIYNLRQQYLLAHEIGHMWFYGMIGSNETYRAMMDEGFTQFLTVWSLDDILGPTHCHYDPEINRPQYIEKHLYDRDHRYERLYYPYLKQVHRSYDHQLNTHSSQFNGAVRHGGGYGLVYYKTGVMLYNLKYVLGDELFKSAMQHYFDKWKMKHPYPEDFRQSIIEFTRIDLNWFFDQWIETDKFIDYSIHQVKTQKGNSSITLKREGRMQMPVDLMVIMENGDSLQYHIPNSWFIKKTTAEVLPKWYGWDNIKPTYSFTFTHPSKIKNVIIDPSRLMADVDMRNNVWRNNKGLQFDHLVKNTPHWKQSEAYWRPAVDFNRTDGLKMGLHFRTNYFKEASIFKGSILFNSGFLSTESISTDNALNKVALQFAAQQNIKSWSHLKAKESFRWNNGLLNTRIGFEKTFTPKDYYKSNRTKVSLYLKGLYRKTEDSLYLLIPDAWSYDQWNNSLNLEVLRSYRKPKNSGSVKIHLRTQGVSPEQGYAFLNLSSLNNYRLKKFTLRTRLVAQLGSNNLPIESSLYMNGANPESLSESQLLNAQSLFTAGSGNFHQGGGLNVRGTDYAVFGNSGASLSMEFDFKKLINWRPRSLKKFSLSPYLFHDTGVLHSQLAQTSSFGQSAGLGSLVQYRFRRLDIPPLQVRIDYPTNLQTGSSTIIIGFARSF